MMRAELQNFVFNLNKTEIYVFIVIQSTNIL